MAELGKADQGGGGTVAAYMAKRNIDTLDAGVPVLSMHAPFETVCQAGLLHDLCRLQGGVRGLISDPYLHKKPPLRNTDAKGVFP